MRTVFTAILIAVAAPALGAELPRDVAAFMDRRDRCDHFRGEEAYDAARRREIERGMRACRGTDAELARLKRRYAGDRDIRARLDAYEPAIE